MQFKIVQQHCLDFFMEIVSQCCFSPLAAEQPSDKLYKKLLEIITDTENEEYKELFPIDEEDPHSCPIARSVLLQLLLQHKYVCICPLKAWLGSGYVLHLFTFNIL